MVSTQKNPIYTDLHGGPCHGVVSTWDGNPLIYATFTGDDGISPCVAVYEYDPATGMSFWLQNLDTERL